MRRGAALAALATLVVAVPAQAAPSSRKVPGPCSGCLSSLPDDASAAPLLVLLHGDGETAVSMFDAWAPAAARRGIAVLALACPTSEGCASHSWWKWDGDPSWILRQVSALGELHALDPERRWIAGWSGGASYLGWRTQAFEETFAAIVLHGGGMRPARSFCAAPEASIYFLGGDRNPLHELAERLRDHYVLCHHDDLTWVVLHGADHDGERRALASRREGILDWLQTRRRSSGPSVSATADAGNAPVDTPDAAEAAAPGASVVALPTAPAPAPPPAAGCRCALEGAPSREAPDGSGALVVAALVACRRSTRAERGTSSAAAARPGSGPRRASGASRRPG